MLFKTIPLFAENSIKIEVIDISKEKNIKENKEVSISEILNKINNNSKIKEEFSKKRESIAKKIIYNKPSGKIFLDPLKYLGNDRELKSLYGLQNFKKAPKNLKRYGLSFFKNKNKLKETNIPIPDYYILNKGDKLSIWIYGATNKNILVTIDRDGAIKIPRVGPVKIAGKSFGVVKKYLKNMLENMYSNSNVIITLDSYSTIQVNLVGEVKAPGVYNVGLLSTVRDLLIEADGILESGSLRNIFVERNNKIIAKIDFYEFLNGSLKPNEVILHSGDLVFVPKAKKIVSIYGAVTHPAKYELKKNETLKDLLKFAKGLKYSASKYGFIIKRYKDNSKTQMLQIDYNKASNFKLNDGDEIYVYKIDKVHKESIYIKGNVVRPGERELPPDHSLKHLIENEIKKFKLKGVFLKDTLFDYVLIKHTTKNLTTEVKRINFLDILRGKKDYILSNNDEIYFLNKYNSILKPYVTIKGKPVSKPGRYDYYKGLKVLDLIQIAGAGPYSKIRVTTYNTKNLLPYTKFVDENYSLAPFDYVELLDYYLFHKIKHFIIKGEVNLPGKYTLNEGMSIADAIEISGGFTEKAYREYVELLRYFVKKDKRVRKIMKLTQKEFKTFKLQDNDEITVFKIPNWHRQKSVTLKGEVKFPGTYLIETGEKLSSVIERAGGFTDNAFIEGAVFTRKSLRINERRRMKEAMMKLKQQIAYLSTNDRRADNDKAKYNPDLISIVNLLDKQTKEYKPIGRLVIHLDRNLTKFKNSVYDIRLQDKDTLIVPSYNDTVSIFGEVLHPTSFVYRKNFSIKDYINSAGGLTDKGDEEMCYVIYPDGSAKKVDLDSFFGNNVELKPGSTIVVPMKMNVTEISDIFIVKDITQIFYQIALTIASLTTAGVL